MKKITKAKQENQKKSKPMKPRMLMRVDEEHNRRVAEYYRLQNMGACKHVGFIHTCKVEGDGINSSRTKGVEHKRKINLNKDATGFNNSSNLPIKSEIKQEIKTELEPVEEKNGSGNVQKSEIIRGVMTCDDEFSIRISNYFKMQNERRELELYEKYKNALAI